MNTQRGCRSGSGTEQGRWAEKGKKKGGDWTLKEQNKQGGGEKLKSKTNLTSGCGGQTL